MGRRPAPCGTVTRYKRGCRCEPCVAAWRAYYEANKQQITERVAAWRKANPEKLKAQTARHRENRRDHRNAVNLERYYRRMAEDPAAVRAERVRWTKSDKGQIQNRLAAHRRRGARPTAEAKAFAPVLLADPCSYCGGPGGELDHISPVVLGGGGDVGNLAGACRSCNARKNDQSLLEFLAASA